MSIATKALFSLVVLGVVDVLIPIPIVGLILIYVILQKPSWFTDIVRRIYDEGR